jgi:hypothetical protein
MVLCVLKVPVGTKEPLRLKNWKIQRPGGQEDPTEVGVLRQVVSELTTFVSYRGKTRNSCDFKFCVDRLKQCRQGDVKKDQCPIQPWKGR